MPPKPEPKKAAGAKPAGWLARLRGGRKPNPAGSGYVARDTRGDLTVAALGITLGLICALFPWYIFFNPDKFGVRAVRFSGGADETGPISLYPQPDRIGAPMDLSEIPPTKLDLFATGTALRDEHGSESDQPRPEEQPFPADEVKFHLVHVANGRAMMADDAGMWLVQKGSLLPDNSTVASIEQRGGRWVVVTSEDRVIAIGE